MAKRRGHGEGSIHQRKDGRWCAIVDLGWVNGKRKRKYLYGATRKEVADALKVLHRDLAAGVAISTDRQTVKTFLTRWLSEVVSQRNKTRTYEGYERIVELYLTPSLGTIPLGKLGPQHVQHMVNELVAKGLAPNTIRNVRAVLRRALNQAMRWRLVTYNAASLVETPRIEQEEMSALTEQQARALQRTRTKGLIISTPKTKSSLRSLSIPRVLLAALKNHKEQQDREGLDNPHNLVFISTKGTPIDPDDITHRFKAFVKEAGLPDDIHFHSLRHSCATLLLAQGVPMYVVKEILGHSQISTTMRYTHPTPDTMRDATAEMDTLFPEENEDQKEDENPD